MADVFQFTPLREGRRPPEGFLLLRRCISIHAPPRGATSTRMPKSSASRNFNSRPSARGDQQLNGGGNMAVFQFTPLREGRPSGQQSRQRPADFNSRPSARGDELVKQLIRDDSISIHAPPRGATQLFPLWCTHPDFNSRPSARGDDPYAGIKFRFNLFQFTPLREGRLRCIGI